MKNLFKLFGIIALAAVIGFSMVACGFGSNDDSNNGGNGGGNNGGGNGAGGGTNPSIIIKNNTGYTISGIYIKSSTATDWGSNLLGYPYLSDGASRTFTLSKPLSTQSAYDIRLVQSGGSGYNFIKNGVTMSEGMIVTFTAGDWVQ